LPERVPHRERTVPTGADRPGAPGLHGALYLPAAMDTRTGRVVVIDPGPGETWTFDVCTNVWYRMHPQLQPDRMVAGMVYDSAHDLTVAVVQTDSRSPVTVYTYALSDDRWSVLPVTSPAPAVLAGVDVGYDAGRARVLLRDALTADLWAFDEGRNAWTLIDQGPTRPPDRDVDSFLATFSWLSYDAGSDRLVLALVGEHLGGQTWAFDLRTDVWQRVADLPTGLGANALESGGEVAYDAAAGCTVILKCGVLALYDAGTRTWTTLLPLGLPVARREHHTLVYDPVNERVLVIGGQLSTADGVSRSDDLWACRLPSATWTLLVGASADSPI
jgi:hypothetical protein